MLSSTLFGTVSLPWRAESLCNKNINICQAALIIRFYIRNSFALLLLTSMATSIFFKIYEAVCCSCSFGCSYIMITQTTKIEFCKSLMKYPVVGKCTKGTLFDFKKKNYEQLYP